MIGLEDVYKIFVAMVPLYVALGLGYGSVKWWGMFKPDQCDAINRFNCYFIIPFFTFQFTSGVDPYTMNYHFLAGDVVAKAIVGLVLALWANLWKPKSGGNNLSWAITSFSLSCFNNTLVVGVPLLKAMYGPLGQDLVVQSSVIQALIWFPILLFLLELNRIRSTNTEGDLEAPSPDTTISRSFEITSNDGKTNSADEISSQMSPTWISTTSMKSGFRLTMKKVSVKLSKNPNCYACALGLIWALLAKRWGFEMPSILEGSILIMAKAGSGVAMFTMGLFMALQDKVIACGVRLAIFGMILRFIAGPLTTVVGSLALGLRSDVLRVAIIQAALPQAIASFVFAQEYGLHANILSTAVIFGTMISLPLLIGYYIALDILH